MSYTANTFKRMYLYIYYIINISYIFVARIDLCVTRDNNFVFRLVMCIVIPTDHVFHNYYNKLPYLNAAPFTVSYGRAKKNNHKQTNVDPSLMTHDLHLFTTNVTSIRGRYVH